MSGQVHFASHPVLNLFTNASLLNLLRYGCFSRSKLWLANTWLSDHIRSVKTSVVIVWMSQSVRLTGNEQFSVPLVSLVVHLMISLALRFVKSHRNCSWTMWSMSRIPTIATAWLLFECCAIFPAYIATLRWTLRRVPLWDCMLGRWRDVAAESYI